MQSEIFQAFILYNFDDYGWVYENLKFKSQNIWILHKKSIKKKDFKYRNVSPLKSIIKHMSNVGLLGLGPFCMNYILPHCNQPVALLRCYEDQDTSIVAFSSSALFGLMSLIFLFAMPNRFSMGSDWSHKENVDGVQVRRICWPIKHTNPMVIEPGFGTFGSVGRCQVLLENEVSISTKLVC